MRLAKECRFDSQHVTLSARVPGCVNNLPVHHHESWELAISLKGPLFCHTPPQSRQSLRSKHLVILPPGLDHVVFGWLKRRFARRSWWLTLFMSLGEVIIVLKPGHRTYRHIMSTQEKKAWAELLGTDPATFLQRNVGWWKKGSPWLEPCLDANFKLFFASLAVVIKSHTPVAEQAMEDIVTQAFDFIHTHYSNAALAVSDVAAAAGVSESRLAMIFSRTTGASVWRTLVNLRLHYAKDLLGSDRQHSVKEVAARTGWSNQLYFSQAFHRRYGYAPSAVRKNA